MDSHETVTEQLLNRNTIRQALKRWDRADLLGALPLATTSIVANHRQQQGYDDTPAGRGLALRELLRTTIEALKPTEQHDAAAEDADPQLSDKHARPYLILHERFVNGRNLGWIASQLHISQRTCQYEQSRALDLLVDRLRHRAAQLVPSPPLPSPPLPSASAAPSDDEPAKTSGALSRREPSTFFYAPPRPHHPLIGRQSLLAQIRQQLQSQSNGTTVALHGLPGIGKSALTIALAHDPELLKHYTHGVLWIGLGPTPDKVALLGIWCKALGISANELSALSDHAERARLVQSTIGMQQMLLIIDDAWRLQDALAFQVGGPNCSYLLTTRFADVAYDFAGQGTQRVGELSNDEGYALLEALTPDTAALDHRALFSLVEAVGGLPLALTLMGKHLGRVARKAQPRRLRNALTQLQEATVRFELTAAEATGIFAPGHAAETPRSLYAAIDLTVAELPREVQYALQGLAFFPAKPNTFSEEAATQAAAISVELLDLLVDVALVESLGEERYTLHQTITDYARLMPERAPNYRRRVALFTDYFVTFAQAWQGQHERLAQELENIFAAFDLAVELQMEGEVIPGIVALSPFLIEFGYLQAAQTHLTRALDALQKSAHPPTPQRNDTEVGTQTVDVHSLEMQVQRQLGVTLIHLGRHRGAHKHLTESLTLALHLESEEALADCYLALGLVNNRLGEPAQSQEHLEDALSLYRAANHRPGEMKTLAELGTLMLRQSRYHEASSYFEATRVLARELGDQRGEVTALFGLGETAKNQADFGQARACQEAALTICRAMGNRFAEGKILHGLANVLLSLGDSAAATEHYLQGVQIFRAIGARADESRTLNNLGLIQMNLGDFAQAAAYFKEAIAIDEETGSLYSKGVALHNLGRTYLLQGEFVRAQSYYQEALTIARSINDRESEARTLRNLGHMQLFSGEYEEAERYFKEALHIVDEIANPLGRIRALRYLGLHAYYTGDRQQALAYGQEALASAQERGHPTEQGDALTLIGDIRWAMEQLDAAATAYQQALAIRRALGEDHLAIETVAGLAGVQQALGRTTSAQQAIDEIVAYLQHDPTVAGTLSPLRIYWIAYQFLKEHDPARAANILQAAHDLLATWAAQFTTPQRERYLQNIAVHRKILAENGDFTAL